MPNDEPNTMYVVICQFEAKRYQASRLQPDSREQIINDIISGELDDPRAVYEFNPEGFLRPEARGWSQDISKDIAIAVAWRVRNMMANVEFNCPSGIRYFIEEYSAVGELIPAAA